MKALTLIISSLLMSYSQGQMSTRRKLTRVQEDVRFLRILTTDLRRDVDDLYDWRNVTFADGLVGLSAAAIHEDSEIVEDIEGQLVYIMNGLQEEKLAHHRDSHEIRVKVDNVAMALDTFIVDNNSTQHALSTNFTTAVQAIEERHTAEVAKLKQELAHRQRKFGQLEEEIENTKMVTASSVQELREEIKRLAKLVETCNPSPDTESGVEDEYMHYYTDDDYYTYSSDKPGWLRHGNSLYKLFDSLQNAKSAAEKCGEEGGFLVEIDDESESDFVQENFGNYSLIWIGVTDEQNEGEWKWFSGRPVLWQNWYPGEPNNTGGNEHCVDMGSCWLKSGRKCYGAQWNDLPCDKTLKYVCEINV